MSERNLAALTAAIERAVEKLDPSVIWTVDPAGLAREIIASDGVLVPRALTDEEAHDIRPGVYWQHMGQSYEELATRTRSLLEDIAKGETE